MKKCFVTLIAIMYCLSSYSPTIKIQQQFITNYFAIIQEVEKIAKAIRKIESNNNYQANGLSGDYGAYQFMPKTWDKLCMLYFVSKLEMTEYNQDMIAEFYIKDLVKTGYTPKQIASIWNCGSPKWEGKKGVNKFGVKYNVPYYVKKFEIQYLKQL